MTVDPYAPLSWDDPLPADSARVLGYLIAQSVPIARQQIERVLCFSGAAVTLALAPLLERRLVARVGSTRFRALREAE